ncbi:tonB1 protein, partial [Vibrio cholerae HC-64A1]
AHKFNHVIHVLLVSAGSKVQ